MKTLLSIILLSTICTTAAAQMCDASITNEIFDIQSEIESVNQEKFDQLLEQLKITSGMNEDDINAFENHIYFHPAIAEIMTKRAADGAAIQIANHKNDCDGLVRAGKSLNDNTKKYWVMAIEKLEQEVNTYKK